VPTSHAAQASREKIIADLILTATHARLYNRLSAKSGEKTPNQSKTWLLTKS
jgi:hypothetical protein